MNTCRRTPGFSRNQPKLSPRNSFRCNTYRLRHCNPFIRNTYKKHEGRGAHLLTVSLVCPDPRGTLSLSRSFARARSSSPFFSIPCALFAQNTRDDVMNAIPNSECAAKQGYTAAVLSTARRAASRRVSVGGRGFSRDIQSSAKKTSTLVLRIRDVSSARAETVFPAFSSPSGVGLGASRLANPLATAMALGVSTPPHFWRLS
jgi:hypothetical protein